MIAVIVMTKLLVEFVEIKLKSTKQSKKFNFDNSKKVIMKKEKKRY